MDRLLTPFKTINAGIGKQGEELSISLLYEDNHILLVNKSSGLLSQEDISKDPDVLNLLKDYLVVSANKKGNAYLGLLHRLDRPVSGLMLFAKTSKAAGRLSKSLRDGQWQKYYLAVVHGKAPSEGIFEDYISNKKKGGRYFTLDDKNAGKYAKLSFRREAYLEHEKLSLVSIRLYTGRSHQIRLQFAERSLPLAGDRRYGLESKFDRSLPGICLHAYALVFPHPSAAVEGLQCFRYFPEPRKGFDLFEKFYAQTYNPCMHLQE